MHPDSPHPESPRAVPPPTHDAAIDDALAGLTGLDAVPVAEHVDRFDAVHVALTAALAGIDKV